MSLGYDRLYGRDDYDEETVMFRDVEIDIFKKVFVQFQYKIDGLIPLVQHLEPEPIGAGIKSKP